MVLVRDHDENSALGFQLKSERFNPRNDAELRN